MKFSHSSAFVSKSSDNTSIVLPKNETNELAHLRLAVKDLFHISGLPTSAGNPQWLTSHKIPSTTHSSVTTLLSKGAKYVGKTLTDELAYSLNGQNIHYPTLLNPITPERLVGGSSSGSAAAVSSLQADIGLGTDTGGSIRVPASYNGLFGLRPTYGAIECDNMVALAPSFDTVGWMTRDLSTLNKVAFALMTNNASEGISQSTLTKTARIFVADNLINNTEHAQLIKSWIKNINVHKINSGILDLALLRTSETFRILQGSEIWQQHSVWIEQHQPNFATDIANRINWCKTLTDKQVTDAHIQKQIIAEHITTIFNNNDVILIPTTPGCAPLLDASANDLDAYRNKLMSLTSIAGLTQRPQLHLPLFTINGAPCGISLIGNKNSDLNLIALANALIKQSQTHSIAS